MASRSMCDPATCWLCKQTPEGKTCTHPNEGEVLVAKRNRFGGYWPTRYHMWCRGNPPKKPKLSASQMIFEIQESYIPTWGRLESLFEEQQVGGRSRWVTRIPLDEDELRARFRWEYFYDT